MEFEKKKYENMNEDAPVDFDADVSDNNVDVDVEGEKNIGDGEKNLLKKPLSVDEHRALRRKTKKLARQNSKEGTLGVAGAPNFVAPHRRWKNSRRSRNGYGRGLPKKAGGGRGNWGKMCSELLEEDVDPMDPNFNEDEDYDNVEFKEIAIDYSDMNQNVEDEFMKNFELAMLEYYEHGNTAEVAVELDEHMKTGALRPLVVRKAIEMALEHKNSHREMTSVLISDLYGRCLIATDIERGFTMLLTNLPDLILDTPEAPHLLGNFIARAIADDCLPPKFVNQWNCPPKNGHVESNGSSKNDAIPPKVPLNDYAKQALEYAEGHLSLQSGWTHLDNIWGVAGGLRPVKSITLQMELLLKEYLLSRDIEEALRCINALEVPHFHHELIYEAVVMTLEALNEGVEEAMGNLLKSLDQTCIVTPEMMNQGFERVYNDIQDISLDIPLAYIVLERFVQRCHNLGVLSEKIVKTLPSRGRKRFVSEGDSGLIKPNNMMFRDY